MTSLRAGVRLAVLSRLRSSLPLDLADCDHRDQWTDSRDALFYFVLVRVCCRGKDHTAVELIFAAEIRAVPLQREIPIPVLFQVIVTTHQLLLEFPPMYPVRERAGSPRACFAFFAGLRAAVQS